MLIFVPRKLIHRIFAALNIIVGRESHGGSVEERKVSVVRGVNLVTSLHPADRTTPQSSAAWSFFLFYFYFTYAVYWRAGNEVHWFYTCVR